MASTHASTRQGRSIPPQARSPTTENRAMHQHPGRPPIGWLFLATLAIAACDVESAPNPPDQPAPGAGHILLNVVSAPATGIVGAAVASPITVHATDLAGKDLVGQKISFSLAGTGSVQQSVDTTDAAGLASPGAWTLGNRTGTQRLIATASGTILTIEVKALTTPGAFDTLVAPLGLNKGDFVAGLPPSTGLAFVAVDSFENRNGAGIPVRWTALEGTLVAADSLTTTNAAGVVSPRWILSTLVGPQRLIARYSIHGSPAADTVTVNAICTNTALALGGSAEGQWRVSDCHTATQRRDEFRLTIGTGAGGVSDMRAITVTAAAGRALQLRKSNDYVATMPPSYLFTPLASAIGLRYIMSPGVYFAEALSPALADDVYGFTVGSSLVDRNGYWARVGCAQAGDVPVYVARGIDGFNFHDTATNTCNLGGLGAFQDRYLLAMQAGDKVKVTLLHGTTGNGGLATPQFVLNLRDAATAGGAVVATAPVPATPNAATANAWVMTYTATATGTFEIIVGPAAAYNLAFGMDYELQVE